MLPKEQGPDFKDSGGERCILYFSALGLVVEWNKRNDKRIFVVVTLKL